MWKICQFFISHFFLQKLKLLVNLPFAHALLHHILPQENLVVVQSQMNQWNREIPVKILRKQDPEVDHQTHLVRARLAIKNQNLEVRQERKVQRVQQDRESLVQGKIKLERRRKKIHLFQILGANLLVQTVLAVEVDRSLEVGRENHARVQGL